MSTPRTKRRRERQRKDKGTYNLPLGSLLLGELVTAELFEQLSGQVRGQALRVQVVSVGVVLIRVDVDGHGLRLGEDTVQARGTPTLASQGALGSEGQGDGGLVHFAHGAGGREGGEGKVKGREGGVSGEVMVLWSGT